MRSPASTALGALTAVLFAASCGGSGGDGPPVGGDAGPPPGVRGETGMLVGITEAHNRVRAATGDGLPALTWDADLAAVAQAWSDGLAASGCGLTHSGNSYGENLAWFGGYLGSAQQVVDGWVSERECYTFGPFMRGDVCVGCERSGGCGHYTQVVWRETQRLGCGVAVCDGGSAAIWTCNYDPPGNFLGQEPY